MEIKLTLNDNDYNNNNKTAAILYAIADLFADGNTQAAGLARFETPEADPSAKLAEARAKQEPEPDPVPFAEETAAAPQAVPVAPEPTLTITDLQRAAGQLVIADSSKRAAVRDLIVAAGASSINAIPADKIAQVAAGLRALGAVFA